MKNRIIPIIMFLLLFAGCTEDSAVFNPEESFPSLGFADPEKTDVAFDNTASSHEIKVSSKGDWTCSADSAWVFAEKGADGQSIKLTVTENDTPQERTASVGIYMNNRRLESIFVFQQRSVAVVEKEQVRFGTYEAHQTVKVVANCSWTCSVDSDWVSVAKGEEGNSFTISVTANDTDAERNATVGVYIGEYLLASVAVTQDKPYAYADVSAQTFRSYEKSLSIGVRSNCSWSCSADRDWLLVENTDKGQSLLIGVRENTTGSPRTATVSINTNNLMLFELTVTQNPAETPLVKDNAESANCYIITKAGNYTFPALKGNSNVSVGSVSSVEVLWESFGTSVKPNVGDLVQNVFFENGAVFFSTPSVFKEGNAVIAAKDAAGTILWSWHIWLTDSPQEQIYYNNAGTMMDRNLGATSATPGDVGALGLLYQWGRKDPFLGASSIAYKSAVAKSTITWPSVVISANSTGTIDFTVSHPTTFIQANKNNYDWYYSSYESNDITRWPASDNVKSIYDPCPSGWRVPDGDLWVNAIGSTDISSVTFDKTNEGVDFSGIMGAASSIWYPAAGFIAPDDNEGYWAGGDLTNVELGGNWWSASHYPLENGRENKVFATIFQISQYGDAIDLTDHYSHANGLSVRCVKE